jgi:hypothetical protein
MRINFDVIKMLIWGENFCNIFKYSQCSLYAILSVGAYKLKIKEKFVPVLN